MSLLGYQRGSDYEVLREDTFNLSPLFVMFGRRRYNLDYRFVVWKQGFWLLEAKSARSPNPANPPLLTDEDIGQAFSYALHPKIDTPFFAISNGWWTKLYDRDGDTVEPILSFSQGELPSKFEELRRLVDAKQITFHLKRRLLSRIEQVLTADIDVERTQQFVREVARVGNNVRPKVLDNWRTVVGRGDDDRRKAWSAYLEQTRPEEVVKNILSTQLSIARLRDISAAIVKKLRIEREGSGQAWMFFCRLFLDEPMPVSLHHYYQGLHVLAHLATERNGYTTYAPGGGTTMPPGKQLSVHDLFVWWADVLLHHLHARPELRMLWAVEGLLGRVSKRLLAYDIAARRGINQFVRADRYFLPEEMVASLRPSPAKTLVLAVEGATKAGMAAFLEENFDRSNRLWRAAQAQQSWQLLVETEAQIEAETPDYFQLLQEINQDWGEFANLDYINRDNDLLGTGVCAILKDWPELIRNLPERCLKQIDLLAGLGVWSAKECASVLERPLRVLSTDQAKVELARIFNPTQ